MTASVKEVPEVRPELKNAEFGAIIESIKDLALSIIKSSLTFLQKLPLL